MKIKMPKKTIEAKKEDIVLICTLGKSSMIIARRMKNGKYESKLTNGYIGDNKIFDSVDDVLKQIQMMVKAHESVIESEIGDLKSEEEEKV
ncbi:MAG: hypothetical protein IJD66_00845 [Methanocorpusculum sp.]|nr:hypothetical protein [Methanocorpusculum sp.]